MSDITAEEIAREASTPTKFSLIDRLRNRNMPTDVVSIYLDEAAGYDLVEIDKELATEKDAERVAALEAERADAKARVLESEVKVTMRAITTERWDELVEESRKKFPVKYEKVMNPLTGKASKEEIESPDRDDYFLNLFLGESLVRVDEPGGYDDEIDAQWFKDFKSFAPMNAVRRLIDTAYKLRMVTEWMDGIEDEDFSPRP